MKNFLVIDDDFLVRESIETMLADLSYNVDVASNGVDGVSLFKQNDYDIVITDIIMPQKEGFSTIGELKSLKDDIKIVAISGGARSGVGSYLPIAKNMGAQEILYKPFSLEELQLTINKISNK